MLRDNILLFIGCIVVMVFYASTLAFASFIRLKWKILGILFGLLSTINFVTFAIDAVTEFDWGIINIPHIIPIRAPVFLCIQGILSVTALAISALLLESDNHPKPPKGKMPISLVEYIERKTQIQGNHQGQKKKAS